MEGSGESTVWLSSHEMGTSLNFEKRNKILQSLNYQSGMPGWLFRGASSSWVKKIQRLVLICAHEAQRMALPILTNRQPVNYKK